ncbi:MAG TPA: ATP-binding protein [bacterium]|nr:ATP-binding protein [bacterium]
MQIAVTGGKGGTGKSTIATALALALAKKSRVLLMDADADCPNDHLLLGMERQQIKIVEQRIPVWNMQTCTKCGACGPVCKANAIVSVTGHEPFFSSPQCHGCGACAHNCPTGAISWGAKEIGTIYSGKSGAVDLLSGELKVNEPASERIIQEMKQLVNQKKTAYDHVIIDTAAGTHCDVIAALEGVEHVLAVTEPTPLGAHDLELILELTAAMRLPSSIIINRYEEGRDDLIAPVAERHKIEIKARVPYSEEIVRSYARGESISHPVIDSLARGLDASFGS